MRGFLAWNVGDVDGRVKREIKARFGRNLHLLAFRECLNSGATARTYAGTDGRAFAAAGESSDQRTESRAATDDGRRALAARAALFLNLTGRDRVGLSLIREGVERDGKFTGAFEFSRGAGLHDFEARVQTFWKHDVIVDDNRVIERGIEILAGGSGSGIDGVNGAHSNDRAVWNGDGDGLRSWGRRWCHGRLGRSWWRCGNWSGVSGGSCRGGGSRRGGGRLGLRRCFPRCALCGSGGGFRLWRRRSHVFGHGDRGESGGHARGIDHLLDALGLRGDALSGEASGVIGNGTGESDDTVLGGDVERCRFQQWLRK